MKRQLEESPWWFDVPEKMQDPPENKIHVSSVINHSIDQYRNYNFQHRDQTKEGGPSHKINNYLGCRDSEMRRPSNLVIGRDGATYIAETFNHVIRRIAPGGHTTTFVGTVGHSGSLDGPGAGALLFYPSCLCTDSQGRIFVSDSGNDAIRMITQNGFVSTVAGCSGEAGHVDGNQDIARFSCPIGIICDEFDRLYVADAGNHCIRVITFVEDKQCDKVLPIFAVTTLFFDNDTAPINWPSTLMVDSRSNTFILDKPSGHMSRITAQGEIIGDFEDYGEERVQTQIADGSGFVIDQSGTLGDKGPRSYVIEKMEAPMIELLEHTQGTKDAYRVMSIALTADGAPLSSNLDKEHPSIKDIH